MSVQRCVACASEVCRGCKMLLLQRMGRGEGCRQGGEGGCGISLTARGQHSSRRSDVFGEGSPHSTRRTRVYSEGGDAA